MASDIGVKMGVTGIAQFKTAMNQAQQSVKTYNAALKLNEQQLKSTGDKEAYMQQKSKLLQQQIAAQNNVVKQGQQALAAMEKNGVNPASQAYQKMQQQVLNAQTALLGMQGDLDSVGQSAGETAQKTDKLSESLNGINKKVSFDAVLNGIGKITDGMEAAARKVASLARDVWDTMAMAASWADNENTLAAMYGIDVETLQRMQGASRTIDTTVEAIIKSQQKLKQNMVYGSKDVQEAFQQLGVSIGYVTGKGNEITVFRDFTDVFWEAGEALMNYNNEVERDAMAQKIFGRGWQELMPLFQAGREEYEKTLSEQNIVTEENVNKLNVLDDALQKLDQDFTALKMTVLSELAPAFTELANGFSGLIGQFNEYIQTDEGKEKLEALSTAVTDLFSGLTDVDFSSALDTAGGILDTITGALGWIKGHSGEVVEAIKAIGGAFLAMKAAEVVGTLIQSAAGLKTLLGGGAAGAATASGAASGAGAAALAGAGAATAGQTWFGRLFNGLSIGALFKTAKEAAEETGFGLWGMPSKLQGYTQVEMQPSPEPRVPPTSTELRRQRHGDNLETGIIEDYGAAIETELGEKTETALESALRMFVESGNTEDLLKKLSEGYADAFVQMNDNPQIEALYDNLSDETAEKFDQLMQDVLDGAQLDPQATIDLLNQIKNELTAAAEKDAVKVKTEPVLAPNAGSSLQAQLSGLGSFQVSVNPVVSASADGSHANGLPFVPFDGYIAVLHKGERVVPAAQNKNYTANSNLFVEKMYMNNGTDANALAAAMAAENQRIRAGFGS